MQDQILLGVIALALGVGLGVVLFVPFVALSYRRRGRLTFGRSLLWAAALIYFWAIWTYTLLPLPDPDALVCTTPNLDLFRFVDDVQGAIRRPGDALTDPAVLQLLLNVLLFMPLGFFLRVLGGRGILTALIVGFGVSAFIETTQLTGVWGIYPCAYRVFDVDDLLTNTLGAVLGSLAAFAVPRRHRGLGLSAGRNQPRTVTRRRRVVGALCDVLAAVLIQLFVGVSLQLVIGLLGDHAAVRAGEVASTVSSLASAGVFFVIVIATGRTIGDLTVQVEYVGGPLPRWLARVLRFVAGIGGFILLGLLPDGGGIAFGILVLAWLILLFATEHGRGLAGIVTGSRLADARESGREDAEEAEDVRGSSAPRETRAPPPPGS